MSGIQVTDCPECKLKGRYEGRVLINGRGFYVCPNDHKWQDLDETPISKGYTVIYEP